MIKHQARSAVSPAQLNVEARMYNTHLVITNPLCCYIHWMSKALIKPGQGTVNAYVSFLGFFCIYSYFPCQTFANFQQTNIYRSTDYFHASRPRRRRSSCLASQEERGDFCPTFGSPWGVFIWQQYKTASEMQVWDISCVYFVPIFILTHWTLLKALSCWYSKVWQLQLLSKWCLISRDIEKFTGQWSWPQREKYFLLENKMMPLWSDWLINIYLNRGKKQIWLLFGVSIVKLYANWLPTNLCPLLSLFTLSYLTSESKVSRSPKCSISCCFLDRGPCSQPPMEQIGFLKRSSKCAEHPHSERFGLFH